MIERRASSLRSRIIRSANVFGLFLIVLVCSVCGESQADTALTTVLIADGFDDPLYVTHAPGDFSRIFVVEKTGKILIIKNGSLLGTPFLDLSAQISTNSERGVLGLAFHPDYDNNGYFYVDYTNTAGDTRVSRFTVSGNPDIADAASEFNVLAIDQPYANHNGGKIEFGPADGYLYIGMGDGGSFGDPGNRAQDSISLLGKILRIDVDGGSPYGIPPSNPFVGTAEISDEIWAFGVRNPWRWAFDRETHDLYIADVGQDSWEEIDFQPADSPGGENYGWRYKEASACYDPPTNCDPGGLTDPIYEYAHANGNCSITGGYVYRGCAIPDLRGTYFFADYCTGNIWSFRYDGSNITDKMDRTAELDPAGPLSIGGISSFGQDAAGELYIVDYFGGEVFKIVPADTADCNNNDVPDGCDILFGGSSDDNGNWIPDECEASICADADASGFVDIDDAVYLITYIFGGGPPPSPLLSGDADCSGNVDIDDVVYIITYIFGGGPAPCDPDGNGAADC